VTVASRPPTLGGNRHGGRKRDGGGGRRGVAGQQSRHARDGRCESRERFDFNVEVNGPNAGEYDRLNVTGSVSLGGATLAVTLGYAPSPGTVFQIIDNDGVDAVTGTFASLADGASPAGWTSGFISYFGGDGNDVTVTQGVLIGAGDPRRHGGRRHIYRRASREHAAGFLERRDRLHGSPWRL
jgi:hypothetical protein